MNHRGFTLIELVMVIVLLGILAVFIAPRLPNVTETNTGAFTDKLKADIRYAQNMAMTQNRRARVYFNGFQGTPDPGYAAVIDGAAADCTAFGPISDPAGVGNLVVTLNTGSYAGITVNPGFDCLEYDSLGRPYNCETTPGTCFGTASGLAISVEANMVAVGTVTVTDQTGAVN